MKYPALLIFLLFPAFFYGQKTLTGLWTGTLTNDSTAIRRDQSIEIALSQYKQKVTGYSRATFIINDTLYSIVKRVKGTIEGNVCEVTDDEIISHNFPVKPEKRVKLIHTFYFDPQDSTWRLDGKWRTTKTKEFYSISGKTEMKEEKNLDNSKLFPHLEELSLADDVSFYKEAKRKQKEEALAKQKGTVPTVVKKETPPTNNKQTIAKKEEQRPETATEATVAATQPPASAKAEEKKPETSKAETAGTSKLPEQKQEATAGNTLSKENNTKGNNNYAANTLTTVKPEEKKPEPVKTETAVVSKSQEQQPASTAGDYLSKEYKSTSSTPANTQPLAATKPVEKKTEPEKPGTVAALPEEKKTIANNNQPKIPVVQQPVAETIAPVQDAAVEVKERKTVSSQVVTFKSDSLQLALYDNGEVDGDTVSVLLNGEVIMAKQGLKVSATRKTIYIEPGTDELLLVLYAENLGKYPPNTGLLMVYDGEDRYQVRFSADLQQNAAIILKRKK